MQIALQDVRKWGYKKIFSKFASTEEDRKSFFRDIEQLNSSRLRIKCSAFSFPRKWNEVASMCSRYYVGMRTFMNTCEPMIDNIAVDIVCQRKFRNQWHSLWKSVAKGLDLTEDEVCVLEDFGIRLAFLSEEFFNDSNEILIFFDAVLCWWAFTQSECSFDSVDITPVQLIEYLVTSDVDSFIDIVRHNFS